jgi:4-hydroxybenzoate polyprenyltransferase/phosphoserine phosphatase
VSDAATRLHWPAMSDTMSSEHAADKSGAVTTNQASPTPRPLCVDLDGTLVATDTLLEASLGLLRRRPAVALPMVVWLTRGAAAFKDEVSRRCELDVAHLPYREEVVEFVRQAKQIGRRVVLTTASHRRTADAVAAHLGLFDDVIATEGATNLMGDRKLAAIRQRLGDQPFDYIGDGTPDIPVMQAAHTAYLVSPTRRVTKAATQAQTLVAANDRARWELLRAMRPAQWAKNTLLAVPMLVGWQLGDPWRWWALAAAFIAFCLAASAVYLINDLFDLAADRAHPIKRHRPLASGRLPLTWAMLAAPLLVVAALLLSVIVLPLSFTGTLVLYLALTAAYSWFVKERAVLDVLWLAGLYTLRIIAGGEATDVFPSAWLLAFAMFLFLSLALAKRYAELARVRSEGGHDAAGRGYRTSDLPLLEVSGVAAGYMTVVILALYINSPAVLALYSRPQLLWLICPLMLYWITRLWLHTHRGRLDEDPVMFAVTDRVSYPVALLMGLIAYASL